MNTSETLPDGIWFRNSPHTADTDRVTGHGPYMGERLQLRCFAWGDSVGPYNDTLWYKALDVSRPTNAGVENSGFINAHYVDDGQNANVVDAGVPDCSAPTAAPTVGLAQGPAAPAGYRYAVTLDHFAASSSVSITCYDSVSPGGFYTFSLGTDGSGHASTASYCFSGDGPDHWLVAGGVESNHVSWGTSSSGGEPPAPSPAPPTSTPPPGGTNPPLVNDFYNRSLAVDWTTSHAKDPQAYGAMCTWFVSNALWAGGFPKTATWTNAGKYRSAPGTKTAWWLPDFIPYLRSHASTSTVNITANLRTNAVPQAVPGDLILYDWGTGDGISHVAFVHDIAPGQYPNVSEMGQFDYNLLQAVANKVVHSKSTYVTRGWTYSQVSGVYLQKKYPNMKAYLLHINGGYDAPSF